MTFCKPFFLSLLTILSTPAAAQEAFLLFSKGHWKVEYQTRSYAPPLCVASVSDGVDVYFSIDVSLDNIEAWYITNANNFGPNGVSGDVILRIDNNQSWVTPAYGQNTSIVMFGLKEKFIRQIYSGQTLYIDQEGDGYYDAWFSLSGSAAALNALADCADKL